MVSGIVAGILSACVIMGLGVLIKKKLAGGQKYQIEGLISEVSQLDGELDTLRAKANDLISKAQEESAREQLDNAKTALAAEKSNLVEIERKLDKSQKGVEEKERIQQELKSGRAEDDQKIAELLAGFADISAESVALEQQLANSMKNLDQIMAEVSITADQRAVLQDLSGVLTGAGARLRDLILEYQQSNERLQGLQAQHLDLEEEYTRLVEQQLGD